jgi:hypothetical protein
MLESYGWSYCFWCTLAVFQNNAGGAWIMQRNLEAGVMINGEMTYIKVLKLTKQQ